MLIRLDVCGDSGAQTHRLLPPVSWSPIWGTHSSSSAAMWNNTWVTQHIRVQSHEARGLPGTFPPEGAAYLAPAWR